MNDRDTDGVARARERWFDSHADRDTRDEFNWPEFWICLAIGLVVGALAGVALAHLTTAAVGVR